MQVLNQPLYVLSILDDQRLAVTNYSINALIVCSDSVTKVFSFTLSMMVLPVYFALHLVTAEALQGWADCAGHQ